MPMTSDEIKKIANPPFAEFDKTVLAVAYAGDWLKEIAYQLSVLNEREDKIQWMLSNTIKD